MKLRLSILSLCLFSACGGPMEDLPETQDNSAAITSANPRVLYFGRLEVMNGALKSADGARPRVGEGVVLRLFLPELASFLCRDYCMALTPHLFVRFRGDQGFREIPNLPRASYVQRGPYASWSQEVADVQLTAPNGSDRIEAYMYFDRISWSGYSCYLGYDVNECPDSFPIDGAYLSNYGRNFSISVAN